MPAQSGLLHTWGHLHKAMKGLRRYLAPACEAMPHFQNVHLISFFRQMCDRGTYAASALKIRFMARYDDRLPLIIQTHASLLRQTVATMLDYALDRYPGVGYTSLELSLDEENGRDCVSFTVWRAGVHGIIDDGVRTWFNRDEMERLVALMGAHFLVEVQHGMEARYCIRIPLIPGDPFHAACMLSGEPASKFVQVKKEVTALVVDDSRISRILGVHMLARHNITADTAESGRMALENLADRRYDLVFMDYAMPGLNGIQTAAAIRANEQTSLRAGLIIGMFSEDGAEGMETAFLEAGIQDCLIKPVDPLKLNLLLSELLPHMCGQCAEVQAQTVAPEIVDSERARLIRKLSGIAGLDAEKGLANVDHSVEIYVGMLRRFTDELTDYIEPLLTLSAGDAWEEVATRLHVLRDFFAAIGAEDLAREAAGLAKMSDARNGNACMLGIQTYCDAMMRLRAGLVGLNAGNGWEEAAEQRTGARAGAERVSPAILRRHVARLQDACLSHRAMEAQAIADSLRKMALPGNMKDQIKTICALVDTVDYFEAQERCARLLKAINPPGQ